MQTCNCCSFEFEADPAWGDTCGECLGLLMELTLLTAGRWERKPSRRAEPPQAEQDVEITVFPLAA